MPTTEIRRQPAGISAEPCTCGCAHTGDEGTTKPCECGCECCTTETVAEQTTAPPGVAVTTGTAS